MRHDPPTAMELTLAELVEIGIKNEVHHKHVDAISSDCHGLNRMLSNLRSYLADELHAMMWRGELTLCSRAERRGEFPCPMHPMTEH